MNEKHRELARQSFVFANELLETALELSIDGQSSSLIEKDVTDYALTLRQLAERVAIISAFLELIAEENARIATK
ncbi:MAG: hypothetical protein GKR93_12615 [Gammaproteobacteria bacterium]|nr:hypothetical protein [Gammaproteobacteria bacterium]